MLQSKSNPVFMLPHTGHLFSFSSYTLLTVFPPSRSACRSRVRRLPGRRSTVAQGDLDIGTYWTALHELAREILLSDKGEEQAEMYWSKLVEFSDWRMAQAQEEEFEGERA